MKKALLFTLEYPPEDRGGVATYLHELHRSLPNVTVIRAKSWWLWPRWLPMVGQLIHSIRVEKFELIVISHVLPVGYAAFIIKKLFKIPYVVFVHGLDVMLATSGSWKTKWFKKIMLGASYVIANSAYTKRLVEERGVASAKITVIRPCVQAAAPLRNRKSDNQVLLSVARLVPRKNHALVIQAVGKLIKDFPKLRYVILGRGPEFKFLQNLIRKLKLEEVVSIVTGAKDSERDAYYEAADIFILPASSVGKDVEGFGVVFLEAARFGLPVIAGQGGGVAEAVAHNETGLLIDPLNLNEIQDAIRSFLENQEKRKRFGEAGWIRVNKEFLCGARIAELKRIYD